MSDDKTTPETPRAAPGCGKRFDGSLCGHDLLCRSCLVALRAASPDPDLIETMPDGSRYLHSEKCEGGCDYCCGEFLDPVPAAPATTTTHPDPTNTPREGWGCVRKNLGCYCEACRPPYKPGWRDEPPPAAPATTAVEVAHIPSVQFGARWHVLGSCGHRTIHNAVVAVGAAYECALCVPTAPPETPRGADDEGAPMSFDPAALMPDPKLLEWRDELRGKYPDGSGSISVSPWLVVYLLDRLFAPAPAPAAPATTGAPCCNATRECTQPPGHAGVCGSGSLGPRSPSDAELDEMVEHSKNDLWVWVGSDIRILVGEVARARARADAAERERDYVMDGFRRSESRCAALAAERDALRARLSAVEALVEEYDDRERRVSDATEAEVYRVVYDELRAALASSRAEVEALTRRAEAAERERDETLEALRGVMTLGTIKVLERTHQKCPDECDLSNALAAARALLASHGAGEAKP